MYFFFFLLSCNTEHLLISSLAQAVTVDTPWDLMEQILFLFKNVHYFIILRKPYTKKQKYLFPMKGSSSPELPHPHPNNKL